MGDIADGIINGDFDQYTGEYLGRGCGFPRSRGNGRKPNRFANKSWSESVRITFHFLHQNGIVMESKKSELVKKYGLIVLPENTKTTDICNVIRMDKSTWKAFTKWADTEIKALT